MSSSSACLCPQIRYFPIYLYDVSRHTTHTKKYTSRSYLPAARVLSGNSYAHFKLWETSPQHAPQITPLLSSGRYRLAHQRRCRPAACSTGFPMAQCLVKAPEVFQVAARGCQGCGRFLNKATNTTWTLRLAQIPWTSLCLGSFTEAVIQFKSACAQLTVLGPLSSRELSWGVRLSPTNIR